MLRIRYTKKWQPVFMFYQEPGRYFPAKVLKIWYIKIKHYPQEWEEWASWEKKENYKWFLFNLTIRYPKIMLKWQSYLTFKFNDHESINFFWWTKVFRKKPKITKVPVENTESIESLVKKSLTTDKPKKKRWRPKKTRADKK